MADVLVTDGEQRSALAVVRSLGRAGHRVRITSLDGRSLAGSSRWCASDSAVASALAQPDAFVLAISELLEREPADFVIPITEPAALALLPARDQLLPARLPFPSLDAFRAASDKAHVAHVARACGIAVPGQVVVETHDALEALPAWAESDVVLKPGRSIQDGEKLTVSYVGPGASTRDAIRRLPPAAFPLLVQQRIGGFGTGCFLLRWDGRTVAAFAHRRVREKPPSGGVSVVRDSVALDPELRRRSERLLDQLDWQGVAMIEFKEDAQGVPYLMEINGRFWGSLQLAIDAGVDFPALLIAAASGQRPAPVLDYRTGVRSRWLMGDVDHLIARARHDRARLNLPADAPGRGAVFATFLRDFLPPARSEIFRISDARPALREVALWLRGR